MLEHTRIDQVQPRRCTLGNAPFSLLCLLDAGPAMPFSVHPKASDGIQAKCCKKNGIVHFRHIPNILTGVAQDNPHIRNHPDNAETRRNIGGDSHCRDRLHPFVRFNWEFPFPSAWNFSIDGRSTPNRRSRIGGAGFQSINNDSNPASPTGPSLCILHISYSLHVFYTIYSCPAMMSLKLLVPNFLGCLGDKERSEQAKFWVGGFPFSFSVLDPSKKTFWEFTRLFLRGVFLPA